MYVLDTRTRGKPVGFVALDKQHRRIEQELTRAFVRLLGTSAYTLGTQVEQFETDMATERNRILMCGHKFLYSAVESYAAGTFAVR